MTTEKFNKIDSVSIREVVIIYTDGTAEVIDGSKLAESEIRDTDMPDCDNEFRKVLD